MGHVSTSRRRASLGDMLVVTLTGRPAHHEEALRVVHTRTTARCRSPSLEIVDCVAIVNEPSAVRRDRGAAAGRLRQGVRILEPDARQDLEHLRARRRSSRATAAASISRPGETFSSTKLSHFLLASPEAVAGQSAAAQRARPLPRCLELQFKLEELKAFLCGASGLRVCLLGETIVDEWVDVTVTNMSQKSRCVAGQETARVRQIGAHRHHRAAPVELREAGRLLHERLRSASRARRTSR